MSIIVRPARREDREAACIAEGKAIRGLRYLDDVWEQFFTDQQGELLVGECEGRVVAVGKYTLLYDGSAWLETLRVDPEFQGRGIGKAFYARFLQRAEFQGVRSMRMYTGTSNQVSKGLAERYGFRLEAAYRGASWQVAQAAAAELDELNSEPLNDSFVQLCPSQAVAQLMPLASTWDGHLVMNRTFYPANSAVFAGMAREGKVYYEASSGSIVVLGYRFLPERGLHLALIAGDLQAGLRFAKKEVLRRSLPQVTIMYPPTMRDLETTLVAAGFKVEPSDCIVMGR